MRMNTRWLASGAALGLMTMAGCAAQLGTPEEELSHDAHEMRVTVDELAGWERQGEWLVSPVLTTPDGASRVGALIGLSGSGDAPAIEARGTVAGDPLGEWTPLEVTWSEEDQHVEATDLAGIGDGAQIRIAARDASRMVHFRWNANVPEEPAELEDGELGESSEALRRELSSLGIVTRGAWGARSTRCSSRNASKSRMAIHHTVTGATSPARQMRAIQRYHMDSRGWCDVGYHFLIGQDGRIFEGRPLHLLGAHVGGHNTGNIGISFIGCFNSSGCGSLSGSRRPSDASLNAAARLVGRLSSLYGIPIDSSRVKGHRDHSRQGTSCPGSYLHARLGTIRSRARSGSTGSPTSTGGTGTSGGAGSCTHSYGGTYADTACSAGWQCCDGRWRDRGACGGCLCVEETGRTGCTSGGSSAPAPSSSEPPAGSSCTHSYGGSYANTACSASWQCCDGSWKSRGSCGSCFCVEESGTSGCGSSAPAPPPGSSCTHSYGGRYANTACSAGWQCCDGSWRDRGACGSCFCVEESGTSGCGA